MVRPGMARPVVFPKKKDLKEDIVLSVGRTMGLTSKQMRERVEGKKSKRKPKSNGLVPEKKIEGPEATI